MPSWAVSVHSCGADKGRPAIKSNPDETLHLCCLEGVWGAWTGISEAAPRRIQPAWLSCSGQGLEVMGQNLNREPDPPATLRRLMTVGRDTQGKWGKHSPHSSYFRVQCREIYEWLTLQNQEEGLLLFLHSTALGLRSLEWEMALNHPHDPVAVPSKQLSSPPLPLVLFIYFGWPDHTSELKGHFGIIWQGKHDPVLQRRGH